MIVKNKNLVERKIHDTYFLIDITENYLDDKCSLYEINDIGDFIWRQLEISNEISDIVKAIVCNVSEEINYLEIYNDVMEFINALISENFLEEIDGRA